MDNVNVLPLQEFPKILISFYPGPAKPQPLLQMVLIHVAHGQQPGFGVQRIDVSSANSANANDRPGWLLIR